MHIAHITATFPPYYGGTGTVCYYNALGLAKRGHDVTVFTAAYPPGNYDYPPEITVKRLPFLFRIGNAPFLPGLQLDHFDIIHLHHPFIFGAEMVWAASKLRHIPYVLTHHNDLIGNGMRRYLFDAYSAISTRLVFGGARKFMVVSTDHARGCRLAGLFVRRWQDVVEVPNAVDVDLFKPGLNSLATRVQHGIPEKGKVILFVGGLDRAHHFKGADFLIRTFRDLNDPDAVLVLIGDGDLKEDLIALTKETGVAEKVFFLGSIANEKLPSYYAMATVLVLPSMPPESFGMVLIEAMACGKPVIASNLPGVRTVVSDGADGFLVEPGNQSQLTQKLRLLLEDSTLGLEMGRKGRLKAEEKYSWLTITERLEQAYYSVVAPINRL